MNAFTSASAVEARGMAVLLPYLEEQADGALVLTSKGTLSRFLQLVTGDALINDRDGKLWAVEIKCEEDYHKGTKNLFLETWSNRNLESKENHGEHGSNPGWMFHSRADVLMYYFIGPDDLYVISLFRLKQWSFGNGDMPGRIYQFPERPQAKRAQRNDTWGRCVPVQEFARFPWFKFCKVRQLALFANGATVAA